MAAIAIAALAIQMRLIAGRPEQKKPPKVLDSWAAFF